MKNSKTFNQNQILPKMYSGKHSEVMRWMQEMLLSKNLIIMEPTTKEPETEQDSSIEVTFLKRSKTVNANVKIQF